jgi:predicted MFS family arabinose efflux permease
LDAERAQTLNATANVEASDETRVVLVLVGLLTLALVDSQVVALLLPEIARSLDTTGAWVGRTVSGYAVAAATAALVVAPRSDRSGRRRYLVAAGLLLGLSSAILTFTPAFPVFALARVVTGAAAGIISALTVAAIGDLVPYDRRGRAMGWVAAAYVAAPILGVPAAGWIGDALGWRANYAAFAALGCLLALAVHSGLRESFAPPASGSPGEPARSYLSFLQSRSTAAGALSAFFVTGGLSGFLLFLSAFLSERIGLSLTERSHVFLLCGVASVAGALGAGRVSDRLGKLKIAVAGSLALALFLTAVPGASGAWLYVALALVGLAASARVAPLQSVVTELVSKESRGAYVAFRNTLSQCGNASAALLAAALYARGFEYVCWMTAAFSLVAFGLLLCIEEPRG